MQTIEASVSVGDDRRLSMQLPEAVPAGEYEVVLVLNQRVAKNDAMPKRTTALNKVRAALRTSVAPGYSLADELIADRRKESECE